MLGPMTPMTDAVRLRMIEEEAVRRQEAQRRAEEASRTEPQKQQPEDGALERSTL